MNNYRVLQLTNNTIGAVTVGSYMPLGTITRKMCCGNSGTKTFDVTTTGSNTVMLNEKGYYTITYNANIVPTADGNLEIDLLANGEKVYSMVETVVSTASYNITIPYQVRVFDNCASCATNNPMSIQLQLSGVAITSGTSNLLIEKVY